MAVVFKRRSAGVFSVIPAKARVGGVFKTISGTEPPIAGGIPLGGVGSYSDSFTTYPLTPATTSGDYYVDPTAGTNGTGTLASPFDNLQSAINAASAGNTILVRAGTLAPSTRYNIGKSDLKIFGYGTERPIISGVNLGTLDGASRVLRVTASGVHVKGFEVINVKQHTDGASDMGTVVDATSGVLFEDIWQHDCPGGSFYMYSATSSRYQDCVFWNNGDGVTTGTNTADGFVATGPGSDSNVFVRCFTANAPDDGFDVWIGTGHTFMDCVTYETGRYANGVATGDGGGYKCGGGSGTGDNLVRGNLAVENRAVGVNNNSATVGNQYINNTSVDNGSTGVRADNAVGTLARNNISLGNGSDGTTNYSGGSNVTQEHNTWNLGITNAQFANPANYDWSLASGSPCIGTGVGSTNLGASEIALRIAKAWFPVVLNGASPLSPTEIHLETSPEPPPPVESGSINVRATDVTYWNGVEGEALGNDWDTNYPISTLSGRQRVVGFRFQVNIPYGATINSATLTPYQHQNSSWTSADNRTLGAEQVDNASVPSTLVEFQNRYPNIGTSHTWVNSGTLLNSEPVPTGDIAAVIQQIVNRPGWVEGNHVMLWCYHPGSGGHNAQWRSVVSQSASVQPQLEVAYES